MGQPLYLQDPPPVRSDAWAEADATSFQVRGATYIKDKRKVDSKKAIFRLLTVDIVHCQNAAMTGLCSNPNERIQRALAREKKTGLQELPDFVFAVNLVVPATKGIHHCVFYFGCDDISVLKDLNTHSGRLATQFFFGDSDQFRNKRFKLIPRIEEGNLLVRKAVGSKPAILGRKLKQVYIRTDRYFELIINISSDTVASKIVSLSVGYAKTLVVDMAFLVEADSSEFLPEQLLGGVRLKGLDLKDRDGKREIEL
mmetsp:Transcript_4273/g.6339  ORF Transcript_4273/g.6339 Transcript_4273/m.6339 type:complete len:255 (+) Transcript_4273:105-869(+)|eukprot:CAMPEP_0202472486 /NCGR_PEP_ID=MMETSP1360-20130828/87939_1 /ASSEMBLY_ACC=CAM_ASM_000848 /TAXON_ID=515479 /ORGANISM="Licmophora paradoxa, Strain CCMP2313" /LENGTH=254 /DNA_ID=CAMNT_0049098993 /DNA_START=38 /DNA_END=802 /DNA_ORIENTATION=-